MTSIQDKINELEKEREKWRGKDHSFFRDCLMAISICNEIQSLIVSRITELEKEQEKKHRLDQLFEIDARIEELWDLHGARKSDIPEGDGGEKK